MLVSSGLQIILLQDGKLVLLAKRLACLFPRKIIFSNYWGGEKEVGCYIMFDIWSLWALHGNMMFLYKVFHKIKDKRKNHTHTKKAKPKLLPVWLRGNFWNLRCVDFFRVSTALEKPIIHIDPWVLGYSTNTSSKRYRPNTRLFCAPPPFIIKRERHSWVFTKLRWTRPRCLPFCFCPSYTPSSHSKVSSRLQMLL